MEAITNNLGGILLGLGLILLLALLTRGNLRGNKKSPVKGCDNCTCSGGTCEQQKEEQDQV